MISPCYRAQGTRYLGGFFVARRFRKVSRVVRALQVHRCRKPRLHPNNLAQPFGRLFVFFFLRFIGMNNLTTLNNLFPKPIYKNHFVRGVLLYTRARA